MSVTIKDVAREANVSVATVSRALNGHRHVAADVRERVVRVARALRYTPHHAARSLSSRRTHTIGVVLPDLYGEFFSELVRGIDQVAREHGLQLLVSSCHGDPEELARAIRATPGRVDGMLVMSPYEGVLDVLDSGLSVPTVLMNSTGHESDRMALRVDNYGGARVMTRHLLDNGLRRIAFIGGPEDNFDARERLRGYQDEMAIAGQPVRVVSGAFDEDSGYRAGQQLASAPPQAVFAANDIMALGCLFALRKAGLRVPEDVALAGFDDVPLARYVQPGLTTMRVDIASLGSRALRLLLQELQPEGGTPPADAVAATQITPQLIVRESSASAGEHA